MAGKDDDRDDVEFSGTPRPEAEEHADADDDLLDDENDLDEGVDEDAASDDAEDAAEDDDEPDEDASQPERKKRSAQERIKELAKARRESEKAAYEAELRMRELERRLEEREAASPATSAEAPREPDPKDYKYGEVDSAYLDAVVDYRVAKKEAESRAASSAATEEEKSKAEVEKYRSRLSEVMAQGEKKYSGFRRSVEDTVYDPDLARMVLDSDNAVDIAYHLSKNVSDLRDLTRASPQERLRKLGRLEGKLSAPSAAKKTSNAPRTPGAKGRKAQDRSSGKYGPDNQDEFDKAFFSR